MSNETAPPARTAKIIGHSLFAVPILALAAAGCAAPAAGTAPSDLLYTCEGGESFMVRDSGSAAVVRFGDGGYVLDRRPSSIGRKFASKSATLIIDGETAVFVSEDRLDLDRCTASQPHS